MHCERRIISLGIQGMHSHRLFRPQFGMKSPTPAAVAAGLLMAVVAVQWMLISFLLNERHSNQLVAIPSNAAAAAAENSPLSYDIRKAAVLGHDTLRSQRLSNSKEFPGVAASIFYSAPAWFHRRYPVTIQNALMNIPKDWAVQLFVNPKFWTESVLPLHPGLERLLEENRDRIMITELPEELQNIKQPNQRILLNKWFWENLVADQVLLFSGNGIFCTHGSTSKQWEQLLQMDYVGTPWLKFSKQGGDGSSHSLRNRKLMLRALEFAPVNDIKVEPPETIFFVKTLLTMKEKGIRVQIASPEDTQWFGGVQTTNSTVRGHLRPIPPPPMVVSGTQAHLEFQEREDLLLVCPELKVIFPSLHDPSCFGAHPDGQKCKSTICALQDRLPSQGC